MLIAFLALALSASQVVEGPSFDCTAALEPAEDAICSDETLARLDLLMDERYVAVRRALSADARLALQQDQRWFLGARDEWFENRDRWPEYPDVAGRLADRADFLGSIKTAAPRGLAGRWRNVTGGVEIRDLGDGRLDVTINTVNPVNARWICDTGLTGSLSNGVVRGAADDDPAYHLTVTLRDGFVHIDELRVFASMGSPDYCGANGSVEGDYFPVR